MSDMWDRANDAENLRNRVYALKEAEKETLAREKKARDDAEFEGFYQTFMARATLAADEKLMGIQGIWTFESRDEDGRDAADNVTKMIDYVQRFKIKGYNAHHAVSRAPMETRCYRWSLNVSWDV